MGILRLILRTGSYVNFSERQARKRVMVLLTAGILTHALLRQVFHWRHIKNSGGRPAGTLSAASFLKKFVKDWPWAHIDIAYCDLEPSGRPYIPKGATGFGVRLLLDLLLHWKRP